MKPLGDAETGVPVCVDITHCVTQAGLKLTITLLSPEHWGHRHDQLSLTWQVDSYCPVPCKSWLPRSEKAWGGEFFVSPEQLHQANCDCEFDLPSAVTVVTIVDVKVLWS